MTTLDSFVEKFACQRVDLIKVDIEGYEAKFLSGASQVLREYAPIIMMEMNPLALERYGYTAEDLVEQLQSYGYDIFSLDRKTLQKLRTLPKKYQNPNVIAIPRGGRSRLGRCLATSLRNPAP